MIQYIIVSYINVMNHSDKHNKQTIMLIDNIVPKSIILIYMVFL